MLDLEVRKDVDADAAEIVRRAQEKRLVDAMDRGFAESQDRAPVDTGTLQQSGYPPEVVSEGTVRFGYRASHARPVEFGSRPHYPPIDPLKGWARRVLGDESAAYAIAEKIAQEGTPAQPFARPGRTAAARFYDGNPLEKYIDRELGFGQDGL